MSSGAESPNEMVLIDGISDDDFVWIILNFSVTGKLSEFGVLHEEIKALASVSFIILHLFDSFKVQTLNFFDIVHQFSILR